MMEPSIDVPGAHTVILGGRQLNATWILGEPVVVQIE